MIWVNHHDLFKLADQVDRVLFLANFVLLRFVPKRPFAISALATLQGFLAEQSLASFGGAEGTRTPDPLHAMQVRYQLRHSPARLLVWRPRRAGTG